MSTCNQTLRLEGKAYPRTCAKCGLGPCVGEPVPANDWIEWKGGACPVPAETVVEYRLANGGENKSVAGNLDWDMRIGPWAITSYRVAGESRPAVKMPGTALDVQVAGAHYKGKAIQPVEYTHANNLGFLEGCIVKRITRWRDKPAADRFEDLRKIKHEVDLLIELETKKAPTV